MARIACVLIQKDEELLLRPWLVYHGYLFGFDSLCVCDSGSSRDDVLATLEEFAALGVRVDFMPPGSAASEDVQVAIDQLIDELRQHGYDIVLPLACNEYLAINGSDGIACDRSEIMQEIRRIHQRNMPCTISYCLENQPGHLDLFRYGECRTSILMAGTVATDCRDERLSTTLILFRLSLRPLDPHNPEQILLRFSGFARLFGAFAPFAASRQVWDSARPPENWLEVDLDLNPFRNAGYLEANPDLSGLETDPLIHFLACGYWEGRRMEVSSAGLNELLERLAIMRDRRPDGRSGYVGLANALDAVERADEGEPIIGQAIRQFGATPELLREYALLAFKRQSYAQAARRWDAFHCLFPAEPDDYYFSAYAHRLGGDLDGADRMVAAGLEHHPLHVGLSIEQAEIAAERGDWARVRSLYSAIVAREPDNPIATGRISEATFQLRLRQLTEHDTHELVPMDAPVNVLMSEADTQAVLQSLGLRDVNELRDFFLGFESLGHCCEFGLVQRRYGAEPLGLFRWNAIYAPWLIEALEERFAGIDEADNLTLVQVKGEYVLRDFRYRTAMHTFYSINETDPETLMRQLLKRMKFLRDKLIADLEQGDKIFIHLDDQSLSNEDLARLHRAVRAYGESTLLYVRVSDIPTQIGAVQSAGDGLFLGYIDRLGRGADNEWNISFDCWLTLCRAVSRHATRPAVRIPSVLVADIGDQPIRAVPPHQGNESRSDQPVQVVPDGTDKLWPYRNTSVI